MTMAHHAATLEPVDRSWVCDHDELDLVVYGGGRRVPGAVHTPLALNPQASGRVPTANGVPPE